MAVEEFDAAATALLRLVHGHVGVAEHVLCTSVGAGQRDAEAGGDDGVAPVEVEGDVNGPDDPFGHLHQHPVPHVLAHDDELVTSQAAHGVLGPHSGPQALADADEHLVAGGMAEGVIDHLEPVEVHEQHADAGVLAAGAGDRLSQPLEHQRAVGQAGERVVVGPVDCIGAGLAHDVDGAGVVQGDRGVLGERQQHLLLRPAVPAGHVVRRHYQAADRVAVLEHRGRHRRLQPVGHQRPQRADQPGVVVGHHQLAGGDGHGADPIADRAPPNRLRQFRTHPPGRHQDHRARILRIDEADPNDIITQQHRCALGDGVEDLVDGRPVGDGPLDPEQPLEQRLALLQ